MSALEALAIVGVGLVAGTINTIVGSGSLVTFPTLLAFGFSPIVANVSNTVGLAPDRSAVPSPTSASFGASGPDSSSWGRRRSPAGSAGPCSSWPCPAMSFATSSPC